MSTHSSVALALAAMLALPLLAHAEGPGLGRAATPEEISAWDISIGPDGAGLPPGRGTAAQGAVVFAEKCAACHGDKGAGKPNDQLVGGVGSLAGDAPIKTVGSFWPYGTTIFDYIRRAMPITASKTLTDDEVYALTAYLLQQNEIVGERDEIDAKSLPKVKMLIHPR